MTGSPDRPVSYPGYHGQSWLSASELEWLIERLPERGLFVEVGTACGVTAAKIADARPHLDIICVDTFADFDAPHVEPNRPTLWRMNQRKNMRLWVGDLFEFWEHTDFHADAILIDGNHAEDAVSLDLTVASGQLFPGGTLFVHDCNDPSPELAGVARAVEEFQEDRAWRTVDQHWTLRALRRA
jgi:predicted O-methyltransferase YrrM